MTTLRKVYPAECKPEAVRLGQSSGQRIVDLEDDLGISRGLLNKWKRNLAQEGDDAFRGHGHLQGEEVEMQRLRKEHALLKQERDSLKKALVIPSTSLRTGFSLEQR